VCGLAGIWAEGAGPAESELARMGEAIVHRGPDSSGVWRDSHNGIGLVHQRLSIVDLSAAGHQPMRSASNRYVLAFNGEIYNHLALRAELEANGQAPQWRGSSDTETLLATVEQHGLEKAVQSWVGMFAFALWDTQTKTLSLGRDRFGEKPLYYGLPHSKTAEPRLLFASELRAILASDSYELEIDKAALALYFRHHYVPAPYSIAKGIKKLPAGCIATFSVFSETPTLTRYWHASDIAAKQRENAFSGSIEAATDQVENLLSDAIRGQGMADVPVGAFLSGGIDSSTVVALMQRESEQPIKTFSIGFSEAELNEAEHAKSVAEHIGTDHTELYLSGSGARELIPTIACKTDEPFADPSLLPTFAVSQLAREQVTVSLSGDGGDELFGGYTRYAQAARAIKTRQKFGIVGEKMTKRLSLSPLFKYSLTGQLQLSFGPNSFKSNCQSISRAIQIMSQSSHAAAYRDMVSYWKSPCSAALNAASPEHQMLNDDQWLSEASAQEAVQMLDVLNYLPDDILTKVDRCGMQVSLESRIPLLDHRLVEFVWSLPTEFRANAGISKKILSDIACRHVPRQIIERPKKGFGIPIANWLRGPLRDWAEELLDEDTLKIDGLIDTHRVLRVWDAFLAGDDYMGDLIWSVLMFQSWYKGVNSRPH